MKSMVTERVIDEIKARTDLADLVSSYGVQVRRAGSSLVACCPFHNEKTPSFHIQPDKGFWHCFGCSEHGDAITFVMKTEGLDFMSAVRKLADRAGVKIEETSNPEESRRKRLFAVMAEVAEYYRDCLKRMPEARLAREYLAKRKIPEDVQEKFMIGYAPFGMDSISAWAASRKISLPELEEAGIVIAPKGDGDEGYHRFSARLMFTINDRMGRPVAFSGRQLVENKRSGKYVNSPETPIFRKSNVLYAFDKAAGVVARMQKRELICCEGQIDTIRLHMNGFANAVASQGTAFTEEHANAIKRFADSAVLIYDDDAAGHKATVKVASLLLAKEMPVRVVSLPGGDDPDSFLMKNPPSALSALIDGAESIVSYQYRIERAREAHPDSIDAVSRISKAIIETIASCGSAVLKASLAAEAARLMGLPASALMDDLSRAAPRARAQTPKASGGEEYGDSAAPSGDGVNTDGGIGQEDASKAEPPSALEFAFMEFLFSNEYDTALAQILREYLPDEVFPNAFTRRFAAAWLGEVGSGKDTMSEFSAGLSGAEKRWFDKVLVESVKTDPCTMDAVDIMQNFTRSFWCERLKAERGGLPASGDDAAAVRRIAITTDIKRLKTVKWHTVKEMIDKMKTGGK